MKHFLTLLFTSLLAITASGAANVGVGGLPVLVGFTNGQYLVISTGNTSNSPIRLVPFSVVSNKWYIAQSPWLADIDANLKQLTNLLSLQVVGDSAVPSYMALTGTNATPVVTKAANSNSVAVTNIVGLLHKAYASVVVLDCNHGSEFRFTNRAASANTTLVLTNLAQGQKINISMLGEISGGTSRTVTIVPQLGYLVGDLDAYGTAPALSKTVTLTNGNGLEISALAKWEIGTNFCDVVTRQYKR